MITIRRANGSGHITKLAGNRRRPYACRKIIGWTEKGTPKYKYISYHKTYREAEKALAAYNNDPYSLSSITLTDIYNQWLPMQEGKAPGTIKGYRVGWNHLEPLHDMLLKDIDRVTLQRFYDELNGTENVAKCVKKVLQPLIDYAVKRGYMPLTALNYHQVIDLSSAPLTRSVDRKTIAEEDIMRLWDISDHDDMAKIILVYLYTGLRYSELYNLKPENCHDNYIEIVRAKTKYGIRTVPICDKLLKILPIAPVPPYTTFNFHFKELLPGYHIHDTRHTFITRLTEAGVDPRIIKAIVGHSTKDITEHYTHLSLDVLLEAVNKL